MVASGPRIEKVADLRPASPPSPQASLASITSGPVDVQTRNEGSTYILSIKVHNELYDEEIYVNRPSSFSLVKAAGETYEPPIPLLRFPMQVGETWTWNGRMIAGSIPTEGQAQISSVRQTVDVCGVPVEAVKVTLKLVFVANQSGPAVERNLTFYFAPERGIFKREFGSSVREPYCER